MIFHTGAAYRPQENQTPADNTFLPAAYENIEQSEDQDKELFYFEKYFPHTYIMDQTSLKKEMRKEKK